MWSWLSFDNVRGDIRHTLRNLRRSPGFTVAALLALAVGIGGNTAIFSVIDATRDQALPYEDPARLVALVGNVKRTVVERRGASYPDFLDWRAQSTMFEDLAAFDSQLMSLAGTDETERIDTEFVSAPYFSLLGARPAIGRTFRADEDDVAKPSSVVVLSDGLWRRRFGGDAQLLGRDVTLNGQPFTVIGVMPPEFTGVTDTAQLWIPFAQWAPPATMTARSSRGFTVLGRLKAGVPLATAQSELNTIASRLEREYPTTNEGRGVEVAPLAGEMFGTIRPALGVLMVAIALVLVIACANVANLLIARSESRRREIALRIAVGAGRGRLLQQLVTESCVLTLLGAVAGLALADVMSTLLVAQSPVTFPSVLAPRLDGRVLGFTLAVSLLCGLAVGLAPWLQINIGDLGVRLRESSKGSNGPRARRIRNVLVVAEVALAIVLLVGAGLMIQSVQNLAAINPGFAPESMLTVHVSLPRAPEGQPPGQPAVEGRVLFERIRAVPGVAAVALGTDVPLDGNAGAGFYVPEGRDGFTAQDRPRAYVHRVRPEFFGALQIPLLRGRPFVEAELTPTSSSVIVSQRVADRFWPGEDPIGKRLKFGAADSDVPWLSIVGVVGEVKYRRLPENPTADPDVYLPFADRNSQIAFAIRTTVPPESVIASVRTAIRAVNPAIAIYGVASMDDVVRRQTSPWRFVTWVTGIFAGVALWLCALGIYGVMSYVVTQRTREFGIRLALGAKPSDVLTSIIAGGMRLMAVGVIAGGLAAAALAKLASTFLFGVTLVELAPVLAIALFVLVGLAACLVPGLRATRLDPITALHQE
jgi:putative ABC transport system permease protein